MNKRKPLQPGDIVTLKPIALLIAEKQVEYQGKTTHSRHRVYSGGPGIVEDMVLDWNEKKIVKFANYAKQFSDNHYAYSESWIKSVKRAK